MPELIWLATGGIQGLSIEKCQVFKNRNVILFPDLGAYDKWTIKAKEISCHCHCVITVSTILKNISTPDAKANGLDIADYLINQLRSQSIQQTLQIQSFFTPVLQNMIDKNNTLLTLIERLQLKEF